MKESAASTCRVFYSEDTDSRVLQNARKFLIDYLMPHPRKQ
jgi:tRNA U54 and U55 pseudouridine synthase Pus10